MTDVPNAAKTVTSSSNSAKAVMPFKITASLEGIALILFLAVITYVMVSRTGNFFESLTSPLTIITIIFIAAVFWGKIHLTIPMVAILILLVLATMFQDKIKDWFNDWQNLFANINNKIFQKTAAPSLKEKIYQAFQKQWAYNNNGKVMFTMEDVDQGAFGVPLFSWERFKYEYYLIITPDIISFEKSQVGNTKAEKITLWVAKHVAEVPVYVDGQLYWVKTKAYVFKLKDPHLLELEGLIGGAVRLFLYQLKYKKLYLKHHIMSYSDYQKFLKEVVMKNLVTADHVFTQNIKWAV